MTDRNKIIKGLKELSDFLFKEFEKAQAEEACLYYDRFFIVDNAIVLLEKQETKQYNNYEVACIIADLFGDPCAYNFNDIDTWLPHKCDLRCSDVVGVACWEQYLKYKEAKCK